MELDAVAASYVHAGTWVPPSKDKDDSMHRRRELARLKRNETGIASAKQAAMEITGLLAPTTYLEHKVRLAHCSPPANTVGFAS